MKVEKINAYLKAYKFHLSKLSSLDHLYRYECQLHWQQNWNNGKDSFLTNYENSLQSTISNHLWGGSKDSAKSVMIELININEQFIKQAFEDLLDETKTLALRMDRFVYHIDDVLSLLQQKDRKQNAHHHGKFMLCVYLTFEYPNLYCLWDYSNFYKMMVKIDSRNIPLDVETERYFKSIRGMLHLDFKR